MSIVRVFFFFSNCQFNIIVLFFTRVIYRAVMSHTHQTQTIRNADVKSSARKKTNVIKLYVNVVFAEECSRTKFANKKCSDHFDAHDSFH